VDWPTAGIAATALVLLLVSRKVREPWVILGAGFVGMWLMHAKATP